MTVTTAFRAFIKSLETRRIWIFLLGFIVLLFFFALFLLESKYVNHINYRIYDLLLSSGASSDVSGNPVIVDIDEKSLSKHGQWPWPRYLTARLLDTIRSSGPAAVLTDILFAEPDGTSPATIQRRLKSDMDITVSFYNLPERVLDNDRTLATSLSKGPFILAYKFIFDNEKHAGGDCGLKPVKVAILKKHAGEEPGAANPYEAAGIICSLPELTGVAAGAGFVNVRRDSDGILRSAPLVIEYKSRYYLGLALATVMKARNSGSLTLKTSSGGLEAVVLDETSIPVDALGNMLIKYPQGGSFSRISAADILSGSFDRERLKDRVVILGISASGLGDLHSVPGGRLFPGIDVHASIIDNVLKRDYLARPGWADGLEAVLILAFGVLSTFVVARYGAWSGSLLVTAMSVGLVFGSVWAFRNNAVFISPLMPIGTMIGVLLLIMLFKYWIKERELKERVRQTLLTQDFTILSLSSMIETRDRETGSHTMRCQRYINSLCRKLRTNPKFAEYLDEAGIERLTKSAPLHDIGKIAVSDVILHKPSKLIMQEYDEIKKHALNGYFAIERAEKLFGKGLDTSFLDSAKAMAISHHERWDGTGYPQGLHGDDIPFAGRVMAIADVYDALISKRTYKPPYSHEEAVKIITENRGKYFDPDMVDAFLEIHEEFRSISEQLPDDRDETGSPY
jgi:HD-GYP domain-containing protein (c-di-GMP phosphodiesterase class II)